MNNFICCGHVDGLGGNIRFYLKSYYYAKEKNYQFINFFNKNIAHSEPFYNFFNFFNDCPKINNEILKKSIIYGDKRTSSTFKIIDVNSILPYTDNNLIKHINLLKFNNEERMKHIGFLQNNEYNLKNEEKITICLHIRRGDILKKTRLQRRITTNNNYIYILTKIIEKLNKHYEIFLFSEGEKEDFQDFVDKFLNIKLFIEKEENRYIINNKNHNKNEECITNLKYMISTCQRCNIFLGAKSHLSYVLAYSNPNYSLFENFISDDISYLNKIYKYKDFDKFEKECEYFR